MVSSILDYLYVVLLRGEYRMKVEFGNYKPVFKPITITLETAQEYFELLSAIGESTTEQMKKGMRDLGLAHAIREYDVDSVCQLYSILATKREQVKETL